MRTRSRCLHVHEHAHTHTHMHRNTLKRVIIDNLTVNMQVNSGCDS